MERAVPSQTLQIELAPADGDEARWCLDRYFADLARHLDEGFDAARTSHVDPIDISPPNALFLVARRGGRTIGCAALKLRDRVTGEVKRMWVDEDARGQGVGRRLLAYVEAIARERGLRALRLDTNRSLTAAQALYRSCGFVDIEPFNDEPFAHYWLGKSLD